MRKKVAQCFIVFTCAERLCGLWVWNENGCRLVNEKHLFNSSAADQSVWCKSVSHPPGTVIND